MVLPRVLPPSIAARGRRALVLEGADDLGAGLTWAARTMPPRKRQRRARSRSSDRARDAQGGGAPGVTEPDTDEETWTYEALEWWTMGEWLAAPGRCGRRRGLGRGAQRDAFHGMTSRRRLRLTGRGGQDLVRSPRRGFA